jgi:hemolysin D
MKSFEKIVPFPSSSVRASADATAFLPAALEIVETPASPAGRAIATIIIAIFCFFVAWASFGRMDIVASASGKIVAVGGTKVVQPLEAGIVRAIHVSDGQRVKAGDVLIELDPKVNESDRSHLQADLNAAMLEIARLKAGLADTKDPVSAFHPPDTASPAQVAMQRDYLIRQTVEYRAKLDVLDRQLDQKQAERDTIQATVGKLSAVVPLLQQRVDIRKISSDQEYTSKFQYLEMLQLLVEQQQDLIVQRSRLNETVANIAALTETNTKAIDEFHRTILRHCQKRPKD